MWFVSRYVTHYQMKVALKELLGVQQPSGGPRTNVWPFFAEIMWAVFSPSFPNWRMFWWVFLQLQISGRGGSTFTIVVKSSSVCIEKKQQCTYQTSLSRMVIRKLTFCKQEKVNSHQMFACGKALGNIILEMKYDIQVIWESFSFFDKTIHSALTCIWQYI